MPSKKTPPALSLPLHRQSEYRKESPSYKHPLFYVTELLLRSLQPLPNKSLPQSGLLTKYIPFRVTVVPLQSKGKMYRFRRFGLPLYLKTDTVPKLPALLPLPEFLFFPFRALPQESRFPSLPRWDRKAGYRLPVAFLPRPHLLPFPKGIPAIHSTLYNANQSASLL